MIAKPSGIHWATFEDDPETVTVTDSGVWINAGDDKGWARLGRYGIMPVGILVDEETGQQWCRLRFRSAGGGDVVTVLPTKDLTSIGRGGDGPLTQQGFLAPARSPVRLVEALQIMIDVGIRTHKIDVRTGTSKCGWNGEQFVRPGTAMYAGESPNMVHVQGDQATWVATMAELVSESPVAALVVAHCIGGYMRGILNTGYSGMLSLYGDTSNGKSMVSKVAVSWQSSPTGEYGRPFVDARSTPVGMEVGLEANRHGFMIIDEAQSMDRYGVGHLVYLSNNGARMKGVKGELRMWDTSIVLTTNTEMADLTGARGHDQENALAARMLEIHTKEHPVWTWWDGGRAQAIIDTLSRHHGHGMPLALDYIRDNKHELVALHRKVLAAVTDAITAGRTLGRLDCPLTDEPGKGVINRQANMIGLLECGLTVMEGVLGVDMEDARVLLDEVWDEVWMRYRADRESSWREQVVRFINNNVDRAIVLGYLHPNVVGYDQAEWKDPTDEKRQAEAAEEHNQRVRRARGEPWFVFENDTPMQSEDDWSGTVWVMTASDRQASLNGQNYRRCAEQAKSEGKLVQYPSAIKEGRLRIKAPKKIGTGYGFIIDAESQEAAATESS